MTGHKSDQLYIIASSGNTNTYFEKPKFVSNAIIGHNSTMSEVVDEFIEGHRTELMDVLDTTANAVRLRRADFRFFQGPDSAHSVSVLYPPPSEQQMRFNSLSPEKLFVPDEASVRLAGFAEKDKAQVKLVALEAQAAIAYGTNPRRIAESVHKNMAQTPIEIESDLASVWGLVTDSMQNAGREYAEYAFERADARGGASISYMALTTLGGLTLARQVEITMSDLEIHKKLTVREISVDENLPPQLSIEQFIWHQPNQQFSELFLFCSDNNATGDIASILSHYRAALLDIDADRTDLVSKYAGTDQAPRLSRILSDLTRMGHNAKQTLSDTAGMSDLFLPSAEELQVFINQLDYFSF